MTYQFIVWRSRCTTVQDRFRQAHGDAFLHSVLPYTLPVPFSWPSGPCLGRLASACIIHSAFPLFTAGRVSIDGWCIVLELAELLLMTAPSMPGTRIARCIERDGIYDFFAVKSAAYILEHVIHRRVVSSGIRVTELPSWIRGLSWIFRSRVSAGLLLATAALPTAGVTQLAPPIPLGKAMAEAETSWRQSLVVRRANRAIVLNVCRVHVCSQWSDERVEHIGSEGD